MKTFLHVETYCDCGQRMRLNYKRVNNEKIFVLYCLNPDCKHKGTLYLAPKVELTEYERAR